MTDYEDMKRGTAREWFWARVVLVGGFVVAIAVAGYFVWQNHRAEVAAQQQRAASLAEAAQQHTVSPEQLRRARADANAKAGLLICAMELLSAKNMGLIPPYGELASNQPRATKKKLRVACLAATPATKYEIQADLICRTLVNPNCMKLHSVKTDDGTMLFEDKS